MPSSGFGRRRTTAPIATHPLRQRLRGGVWLLIPLVLVAATVSGLGASLLMAQAAAPSQVATEFCQDLRAQNPALAASLLSSGLRAGAGRAAFGAAMRALNGAEGPVVACAAASRTTTNARASVSLAITRAKLGQLTGVLGLRQENGSWVIAALPTSLLGVSYHALLTTLSYCADLQAGDYTSIYALLAPSARAGMTETEYADQAQARDAKDGLAVSCVLASVGQNDTDAAAQLALTITRARAAARTGTLTLTLQTGAWRITGVDAAL
jgi:hypothetical protein